MPSKGLTRRSYLGSAAAVTIGTGLAGCIGSDDGDYPQRDITLVVPTPPGTGHDRYGRGVVEFMPDNLPNDVNIVVENAEGAGQIRGINQVVNADPDGYTFGIAGDLAAVIHIMTGELDLDMQEIVYVGRALEENMVMCTAPDSGLQAYDDLRGLDTLRFAAGDPHHAFLIPFLVLSELTGLQDEVDINLITGHENVGERVSTVLAGDADIYQSAITSAGTRSQIADGEVHAVLWYGTEPLEVAQDTPTVADIGYEELSAVGSRQRMFFTTPGVEDEVANVLQDSFVETVNSDAFAQWAEDSGDPINPGGPEDTQESALATWDILQDYENIFA